MSEWKHYRVMAFLVGIVLAVLVFFAMPYKYIVLAGDEPGWYAPAWQAHGLLFPLYVITTFRLSLARRWSMTKTVLIMIAGTVPLMSFVTERRLAAEESV